MDNDSREADVLASFGYSQQLHRAMGKFSSFAASYSGISVFASIFLLLPFVLTQAGTAGIWTWVLSAAGALLVVLVFADLVSRIPLAGYAYQWSSRLANSHVGWFIAVLSVMLGFVIGSSGSNYGATPYLLSFFGVPVNTENTIIGALIFTAVLFLVNSAGVRITALTNNAAVIAELVGGVGIAAALKKAGITPFASGNKEGYENQWWFSTLWAGSQSVDDTVALAKGNIKLTDPKVKAVFQKYQQIQDAGYFASNRFSTPLFPTGVDSFSKGQGAMFLGLSDVAAHWGVFNPALGADNVGVFQAPGVTAAAPLYFPVTATYVWSLPSYTPNKAAALAYIKFLASAPSQQTQYDVAQSFPNNKHVALTGAPANLSQMAAAYQAGPAYQSAHQLIPGVVLTQSSTVINEVLQGRQSLADALAGLQATNEKAHQGS